MPKGAEHISSRVALLISGQNTGDMRKGLSLVNAPPLPARWGAAPGAQSRAEPRFRPTHDGRPEGTARVPELIWFAGTAQGSGFGKRPPIWGRGAATDVGLPMGPPGATVCFELWKYILV